MGETETHSRTKRFAQGLQSFLKKSGQFFRTAGLETVALLKRRFTVMVVPHSASAPRNFTISFTTLVFVILLIGTIGASSAWMLQEGLQRMDEISAQEARIMEVQASVDGLRDELHGLLRSARSFDTLLTGAFASVPGMGGAAMDSDFTTLGGLRPAGTVDSDIEILGRLSTVLSNVGEPIAQAATAVANKRDFLADIPTFWPVKWGTGVVTHEWGPNIHPFYGRWYWHTGFDIADPRGNIPLVAAANGTVVETGYQQFGYGNYIDIEHRFGIRTRYAHMSQISVSVGDEVVQGEDIGIMGSTGMSTGRHVHFEVFVGDQNVDPAGFLTITNQFGRRTIRSARRR